MAKQWTKGFDLKQSYAEWLERTGDAGAAAVLTLAEVQATKCLPAGHDSVLNMRQAAAYLGYEPSGLRKLVAQRHIQHTQNGRGPIRFRREWLDQFIATNASGPQDLVRSPAQRRTKRNSVTPSHGFDPHLSCRFPQRGRVAVGPLQIVLVADLRRIAHQSGERFDIRRLAAPISLQHSLGVGVPT